MDKTVISFDNVTKTPQLNDFVSWLDSHIGYMYSINV